MVSIPIIAMRGLLSDGAERAGGEDGGGLGEELGQRQGLADRAAGIADVTVAAELLLGAGEDLATAANPAARESDQAGKGWLGADGVGHGFSRAPCGRRFPGPLPGARMG